LGGPVVFFATGHTQTKYHADVKNSVLRQVVTPAGSPKSCGGEKGGRFADDSPVGTNTTTKKWKVLGEKITEVLVPRLLLCPLQNKKREVFVVELLSVKWHGVGGKRSLE